MSTSQPPHGLPPRDHPQGHPQAYPPGPVPTKRPSPWWFLLGGTALGLAAAGFVVSALTFAGTRHTDGYVEPGTRQTIRLQDAGTHMVFDPDGGERPQCVVRENSRALALIPVTESPTIDDGHGVWQPVSSFTTTGRTIEVVCNNTAQAVRVGAPADRSQYVRVGAAFLAAAVLGLGGLAALITVAALFFGGRPRKVTG